MTKKKERKIPYGMVTEIQAILKSKNQHFHKSSIRDVIHGVYENAIILAEVKMWIDRNTTVRAKIKKDRKKVDKFINEK